MQYGKPEHNEDINTECLFRIVETPEINVQKILQFNGTQYFELHNNKEAYENIEHLHQNSHTEEQQLLIVLMKRLIEKMGEKFRLLNTYFYC